MSIYRIRTEMGHYFKWLLLIVLVPIFVISGANYFGSSGGNGIGDGKDTGGVIAKVNGVEITRADFEAVWEAVYEQARQRGVRSPLQLADMKAGEFQRMVNDISMLQTATRMGVDISDRRVDEEIEKTVTEYLKSNREAVLGKLTKEEQESDPRDDRRYKQELLSVDSSISAQEAYAKSRIPASQVRAQLAQKGIFAKVKAETKPATDADVTASYDAYKIRVVVLPTGSLPKEQLRAKADKIMSAARAGEDFAKLAKENAPPSDTSAGTQIGYSFETSFGFPPDLSKAITKLKAGEISPVIETPQGLFVIKVDSVTSKMPANLDKKARDQRRDQITQMRQAMAATTLQQDTQKNQKVEVLDPEFLGYWKMFQAQRAYGNPAEQKKLMGMAIASLVKARQQRPNNFVPIAKLVQLQYEQGQIEDAVRILYPMLEGKNATQEGADLRMLLGDMLLKKGDKTRAIDQYKQASEVAMNDKNTHEQLMAKFKQLGMPDLVAAEQKWIVDYDQRIKDFAEMQKKNMPGPAGPGAPKPRE